MKSLKNVQMIKVVAGILRKGDRYLLAKRATHKEHAGKWEFPGGKIEPGEDPERALERELMEEFSIRTKTGNHVITTRYTYDSFKIELMAFETSCLDDSFQLRDHEEIAWVRMKDMNKYDLTGADLAICSGLRS